MTTPAVEGGRDERDERVDDLLGRMTLEEKVAQLGSVWSFQVADGVKLSADGAAPHLARGIGQVTRVSGATIARASEAAELANAIQRHLVEETRLGIPAIVHEEVCSGLMARDATVFPQAIGVASTWSPELARAMAEVTRVQMRAAGAHQGLSPLLDVCRDPRWGRTEETFGEDPYLVARMGMAVVQGLQGGGDGSGEGGGDGSGGGASRGDAGGSGAASDLRHGVVATAKHFVGYGASEGGLNWAPVRLGARELREVYLHPFEAVVVGTGLRSVMNAYQELDGLVPAADRDLLTGILREQWGFDGIVVSDYFSVRQLESYHHLVGDREGAAALALQAGIDVELPTTDCYGGPLVAAVRAGLVDEATVDTAVRRVLRTKVDLGLFEQPYVEAERAATFFGTPEQSRLARRIAERSLVLLRNDGVLPLAAGGRRGGGGGTVAVVGPNADEARHLFGDYTLPAHVETLLEASEGFDPFDTPVDGDTLAERVEEVRAVTVREALAARLGDDRVRYAPGCAVNDGWRGGFDEAVALAAAADVVVLVVGDRSGLVEACTTGESRDRASLDLPGVQEDLARAVVATGTPVVTVLVAGRPCGSAWLHEHCAAVLMAWVPGEQGGEAIADVLTGAVNPGGKLPVSYPRSAGHLPTYYGHKPSGGRSHWHGDYVDGPVGPLYPFGHGLSYTEFALSDVAVGPAEVSWCGELTVEATVTNTGDRTGDEVLQLYVRRRRASVTRPVLELKAFARVGLEPGASRAVRFAVPLGQLGFYDRQLDHVVEPGPVEVLVGTSAHDVVEAGTVTVVADPTGRPPRKAFDGSVTVT
jgi:beta-glucosidase